MKLLSLIFFCFLFFNFSYSQEKYFTINGYVNFFSHSPLEDITADNNQVLSIVDLSTNEVAIHVLLKSFMFKKSLMQEHFNENYVESDKYPKSKFKGKMSGYDPSNKAEQTVTLTGELSLHGKTKEVKTEALVTYKENELSMKGEFSVLVADFDIKIPRTVIDNIAKSIKVSFDLKHGPYE